MRILQNSQKNEIESISIGNCDKIVFDRLRIFISYRVRVNLDKKAITIDYL